MPLLLEAEALAKNYPLRGAFGWVPQGTLTALKGVNLTIEEAENVGLVGESGSGKTTLGKIIAGILRQDKGEVMLLGKNAGKLSLRERARFVQMVFQDPSTSLNPKLSIGTQIGEALRLRGSGATLSPGDIRREAELLMERVGLSPEFLSAYPHQLSGGQRQRVSIARSIAAQPRLVVLDEPVSSLDLSIQAQILNLLSDLSLRLGISYLVISHDLAVVAALCDRILVLKDGEVQEEGPAREILKNPRHPYTRRLLESVPRLRPA